MSVFKIMDGEFGDDGLICSHSVFIAETAEECFRHILETAQSGPLFVRSDACTWWVEEHEFADRDSAIWTELPYPHKKQPEYPEWFIKEMNQVVYPTREELRAAIGASFQQS